MDAVVSVALILSVLCARQKLKNAAVSDTENARFSAFLEKHAALPLKTKVYCLDYQGLTKDALKSHRFLLQNRLETSRLWP